MMMMVALGITAEELSNSVKTREPEGWGGRLAGPQLSCLVMSGDAGLRQRLGAVTELSGWSGCETPASSQGLRQAVDREFQLVVVDLANPVAGDSAEAIAVAEEFASRPSTLLLVCGREDRFEDELWARQLGAFVYLPGVSTGDSLVSLFTEARKVSEQRGVNRLVKAAI
ncbi:MAG: hypothetical protein FJ309_03475 [Planctomycetes bacterium]|nr:hypothetical protein [Planctomycetota bacterium]